MADSRITIGNVEVLGLSDAAVDYPWPIAELFPTAPAGAWEPYRRRYPGVFSGGDAWRSDFGCFLVRSEGRTILVDTGIGPASAPMASAFQTSGCLLEKLHAEGITPDDVDTVILTHLHPDHVGWTLGGESGQRRLTFPRARYVVHLADWQAFHQPEVQQHVPFPFVDETITPLKDLGVLDLISSEHAVTNELTLIHTPGHTPGHMSILIASGSQRAIILGDVAVHPAQVTEPDWNVMFDMDGETARQTRSRVLDRIEADGMTIAACHFPEPGFGRLVRIEGRRYWEAVEVAGKT